MTLAPSCSRSPPSVTTFSPDCNPLVITDWVSVIGPRTTLRIFTVLLGCITQTKSPFGPVRTAVTGTTTAPFRVIRASRTLTNSLGNSAPSALANRALARMVPVVVSTWLSRVEKVPLPSSVVRVRSSAVAGSGPRAACCWITEALSCGTVNCTSIGATSVSTTMPLASPAPI